MKQRDNGAAVTSTACTPDDDQLGRVKEFFWVFMKHQIMFYVLNFVVEIFLILTYEYALGSTDQTMNVSPFYVMWVAGLEVLITIIMSRFPLQFLGQ